MEILKTQAFTTLSEADEFIGFAQGGNRIIPFMIKSIYFFERASLWLKQT
jgi:hypothetical protein